MTGMAWRQQFLRWAWAPVPVFVVAMAWLWAGAYPAPRLVFVMQLAFRA